MKVFIYDITNYIGQAIVNVLKDEDTKFYGTFVEGSPKPKSRRNIYSV